METDEYGAARAMRFARAAGNGDGAAEAGDVVLPACTVFVAAGTQPNTVLAREDAAHFVSTASISAPATRRATR